MSLIRAMFRKKENGSWVRNKSLCTLHSFKRPIWLARILDSSRNDLNTPPYAVIVVGELEGSENHRNLDVHLPRHRCNLPRSSVQVQCSGHSVGTVLINYHGRQTEDVVNYVNVETFMIKKGVLVCQVMRKSMRKYRKIATLTYITMQLEASGIDRSVEEWS